MKKKEIEEEEEDALEERIIKDKKERSYHTANESFLFHFYDDLSHMNVPLNVTHSAGDFHFFSFYFSRFHFLTFPYNFCLFFSLK